MRRLGQFSMKNRWRMRVCLRRCRSRRLPAVLAAGSQVATEPAVDVWPAESTAEVAADAVDGCGDGFCMPLFLLGRNCRCGVHGRGGIGRSRTVIRHFFELGVAGRSRQPASILSLPGGVFETPGMRALVISAVAPFGLYPRQLAAIVVWAVAMAVVAVPADHNPSAASGTEKRPIAIPSTRQATPRGGWTSSTA